MNPIEYFKKSVTKFLTDKRPYKPLLAISLLKFFFNNKNTKTVSIDNDELSYLFFDLIRYDCNYFRKLCNEEKDKNTWIQYEKIEQINWSKCELKKQIIALFLKHPLNYLCGYKAIGGKMIFKNDSIFEYDKTMRKIKIKCEYDEILILVDACIQGLINSKANFDKIKIQEILEVMFMKKYDELIILKMFEKSNEKYSNISMHDAARSEWARAIKNRDGWKCIFTKTNMPEVLEAAHIKDYANNIKERYDLNNGITLRVDIHRAFDREIFTIKNNKVILIADKIQDPFINELIHYIPLANDYLQQMKNRGIEISR